MLSDHARPMRRTSIFLLSLLLALPALAARRRAVRTLPQFPQCGMVTGTAGVTFTHDFGATLAPSAERFQPIAYTYGLAVMLDQPDTLMAFHRSDLLISTDAGCSWRVEATIEGWDYPPRLTPARGGRMYIWSDNRLFLQRYDSRGLRKLKPPIDFVGLGVDAADGEHLRAGGNDGSIWESNDAGESWTRIGVLDSALPPFYRFVFDPKDLDHIVAGTVATGAQVSRNGGRTWRIAEIGTRSANIFELVFSPADSTRVWAEGIDMIERGRHIWVSSDGGSTYEAVVHEAAGVDLINGNVMAAHPTDKDVLFFVFGSHIFQYGTDLYRFNLRSRSLAVTHNDNDGIDAIAFSPADPNLMYLGLHAID